MLFLTEVLGAEVIDIHQRRVGRVRDVTVRVEEPYPVVTGLVISRHRGTVVSWSSVRTLASREVALRTTREDLEHHDARPDEIWLSRDVLDKQVVDTDGRRVVRVNDLQLTESGGQMLLVGADVGLRGIFRRLGVESFAKWLLRIFNRELPMVLVSWDVVNPIGAQKGDALYLRISGSRISRLHPADIADIVEELGSKERRAVFESLTEEIAADTLEEMELQDQVSVIEHMDIARASEILEEMPPDEVADILADLPQERAAELLQRMERDGAADVQELLAYDEDTAGGLMTTEFIAVPETLTVEECIQELRRREPDVESVYYVYVVDGREHVRGVLSLRDLIVADPRAAISDIMIQGIISVHLDVGIEEIAAVMSKYNLIALPVVDEELTLRGIVTVDDALDSVLPESIKRRLPKDG